MSIGHLNLPTVVKEESQYEAEINAAAAKIKEAIRQDAAKAASALRVSMNSIRQPSLQLQKKSRIDDDEPIDDDTHKGHFGWATFGKTYIPYILRRSEKYCALRMVEMELPPNYLNFLRSNVSDCTYVQSYYITAAESRLLNEINFKHLDCKFSVRAFTVQDKIITLVDANDAYQFLHICYNKRVLGNNAQVPNKCGFIRINNDSERLVAYIARAEQRLVPWFYFEGENIENMRLEYVTGWDFSYFKFCFKVQGITDEYYPGDSLAVVNFTDIQKYFTEVEDYWPNVGCPVLTSTSRNKNTSLQHWTKTELQHPPSDKHLQQSLSKMQTKQALPKVKDQPTLPKAQQQPPLPNTQPQPPLPKTQPQPSLPKMQTQPPLSIFPRPERNVAPKNNREVRKYSPYVTATVQRQVEPNTFEHRQLLPTLQNYNSSTYIQPQHYYPQHVMIPSPIFNPGQVMFLPTLHFPTVPSQGCSIEVPNPVFSVIPKPPSNVPNPRFNVIAKPSANVPNPGFNVMPKTIHPSNVRKQLFNTVPKPHNVNQAANVASKNNRRVRKYSPYSTDSVPRPRERPQNVQQALTLGWLGLSQTAIQQNLYPLQPEEVLQIGQSE